MITIKQFEFNPFGENTYVLSDETREAVIVDCGCMTERERRTLSAYIEEQGLTPVRLLCTHLHFDHIIGNAFIRDTYGLQPEASRTDVEALPSLGEQMAGLGLPPSKAFETVPVTKYLAEGDTVRFGQSELQVLATPGHSPGSLSFYASQDGFVLSGDALFQGSIGRTDLWGGDFRTLITAIHEKLLTLPDATVVYSGHGPATTVGIERNENPYL